MTGRASGPWPAEPWRRNQITVAVAVFMVFAGFAFVLPFLPLYVRQLGVAGDDKVALWAGVLIGVAPLLAGLLAPLWGRLGDRHGQKAMAVRVLVVYVVVLLLSAAVTSVWQLLALRTAIGLFGGMGPLGLAMATALAPREHTGRAVGSVQSAQILAAAVGPVAGGILASTVGIRPTFVLTAVACALALALLLVAYEEPPRRAANAAGGSVHVPFSEVLRLPGVMALLAVLLLVNFIGRSFTPILPLHLQTLGVPGRDLALATGALITVYSIAAAVSAGALGRATRSQGPRSLLVASLAAGAIVVVPMALLTRYSTFLLLAGLLGLASGGSLTLCYTIGGLMVPADRRTTAFGFFSAAALFGGAVSPSVAGLLAHWQLRGIYYLDALLYVVLVVALVPGALAERAGRREAAADAVRTAGAGAKTEA
jgi:DHA1 family multidrug resistance protein-like MFS transporter